MKPKNAAKKKAAAKKVSRGNTRATRPAVAPPRSPAPARKPVSIRNTDAVTGQGALFDTADTGADDMADARLLLPQRLAAIAFGVSVQAIQRWKVKPRMRRANETLYYLPDLVHYRLNRDETGKRNLGEERARLASAQADRAEIEIEVMRGTLLPAIDVTLTWSTVTASIRQKVLSIPGKIRSRIPSLTTIQTERIKTIVRQTLEDLADHAADKPKPKRRRTVKAAPKKKAAVKKKAKKARVTKSRAKAIPKQPRAKANNENSKPIRRARRKSKTVG